MNKGEVRIAGPDDMIVFGSEIEALRHANAVNTQYLKDRLAHPDDEVMCVATVHGDADRMIPAARHSAKECSEAFEWLREEATKAGASKHAGVVLDEWHALTLLMTPNSK